MAMSRDATDILALFNRTPYSDRSRNKLVFLSMSSSSQVALRITVRVANVRTPRRVEWALMMRAIKCLKGIRWMPWR